MSFIFPTLSTRPDICPLTRYVTPTISQFTIQAKITNYFQGNYLNYSLDHFPYYFQDY